MSGMFLANHSSIGLRSKRFSALSRNFVIHSGSLLLVRDVLDDVLVEALLGRVDVVVGAVGPAELVLAEIDAGDGHAELPTGAPAKGSAGISTTPIVTIPGAIPNNPGAVEVPAGYRRARRPLGLGHEGRGPRVDELLVRAEVARRRAPRCGLVELGRRLVEEVLRADPVAGGTVVVRGRRAVVVVAPGVVVVVVVVVGEPVPVPPVGAPRRHGCTW